MVKLTYEQIGRIIENTIALQSLEIKSSEKKISQQDQAVFYTSIDAFVAIFKDYISQHKLHFFATNFRYSNDREEFLDGYNTLHKFLGGSNARDKIKNITYSDAYILCFCDGDKNDLLSQWNRYGGKSGISVKIDFEDMNYKFWKEKNSCGKKIDIECPPICNYSPHKVLYDKEVMEEYLSVILNQQDDTKNAYLSALLPLCKNKSFSDEHESRLLFWAVDDNEKGISTNVSYRVLRNIIVPYIEIELFKNHEMSSSIDKNFVREIVVGPGINQNEVFNAIIHMLETNAANWSFYDDDSQLPIDDHGYKYHTTRDGIIIKKSTIPYRG